MLKAIVVDDEVHDGSVLMVEARSKLSEKIINFVGDDFPPK